MNDNKKTGRYERIYEQLQQLTAKSGDIYSCMATIAAVLHHKMDYFFWTGFYMLVDGELTVRNYQGPVACQVLEKNKGVCWAAVNKGKTVIVDDVHLFPEHIACDSRSNSEIVVPLRNADAEIVGVLDVDSSEKASFNEIDKEWLEKIVALVFA
ncbi:MAG: GAF domain-containing protein [Prolixibacteraceae bacterium]|nr:GAF domain-containing protein [Prolixibacteraceae bacterium]